MRQFYKISGIILFLIFALFSFILAEEQITITTYYPSPYGSYRELRSQRMAIGAHYYDGSQYCWSDSIVGSCTQIDPGGDAQDIDLFVQGSVIIGPTYSSTYNPAKLVATDVVGAPLGRTAIYGESNSSYGVYGKSTSTYGVLGESTNDAGVRGVSNSIGVQGESSANHGVYGVSTNSSSAGVYGLNNSASGGYGVYGYSPQFYGVYGQSGAGVGVYGVTNSGTAGVYGRCDNCSGSGVYAFASGGKKGVYALSDSGTAVYGVSIGSGVDSNGVYGSGNIGVVASGSSRGIVSTSDKVGLLSSGDTLVGVWGVSQNTGVSAQGGLYGIQAIGSTYAGLFFGNVKVTGNINAASYSTGAYTGITDRIAFLDPSGEECYIEVKGGIITKYRCP